MWVTFNMVIHHIYNRIVTVKYFCVQAPRSISEILNIIIKDFMIKPNKIRYKMVIHINIIHVITRRLNTSVHTPKFYLKFILIQTFNIN